jgi:hypothetical protein
MPVSISDGSAAMPYFVFRIAPPRELEHLDTLDRYPDARARVRELRAAGEAGIDYRLVFAPQVGEAERLLSTPRDERVIGED